MVDEQRDLPRAYALALWLRDLGVGSTRIAAALDVAPESVAQILRIAELKRAGLEGSGGSPVLGQGVVVFAEGADAGVIEDAVLLARSRRSTLHVVARRRNAQRSPALVADAARVLLSSDVDVKAIVSAGRRDDVLKTLAGDVGTLTWVTTATRRMPNGNNTQRKDNT
jgi:hypothetical protein